MAAPVTCHDIYTAALALLTKSAADRTCDFDDRAPYLMAAFCCEVGDIDAVLRETEGAEPQPTFSAVCIELDENFPLLPRFAPIAAAYIAAMLVLDENEQLSDKLYERYCDAMSELCTSLPATCHTITDVYGFN